MHYRLLRREWKAKQELFDYLSLLRDEDDLDDWKHQNVFIVIFFYVWQIQLPIHSLFNSHPRGTHPSNHFPHPCWITSTLRVFTVFVISDVSFPRSAGERKPTLEMKPMERETLERLQCPTRGHESAPSWNWTLSGQTSDTTCNNRSEWRKTFVGLWIGSELKLSDRMESWNETNVK